MDTFNKITKQIETLISSYETSKVKNTYYQNIIVSIVDNKNEFIKLNLANEYNQSNFELLFSVLYIVEVKDPTKKVNFNETFAWLSNPNISRIVKIFCYKGENAIIYSSFGEKHKDNVIIIDKDSQSCKLYLNKEIEGEISFDKILNAIISLDINAFFNHFGLKAKKL